MAAHRKTDAGKHLSQIMKDCYLCLHTKAAEGAFVVWIAINVPAEIFAGFDNLVYAVPESHSAMNAGKGVGQIQCEKAEKLGYSMDLCSYARIDIGCVSDNGNDSPTFGLPRPCLVVSNTNNCSLLVKWFDVHAREMDIPHFIIDVPFCYGPQKEKDRNYIIKQFKDLTTLIEKMTGQQFDKEKVMAAVSNTDAGLKHWKKFLSSAKHRPAGLTAFDSFVQMAPFLTLRGTAQFVEHYRILADETENCVQKGDVPVPNEKYRLFWDNIAPWHQLRKMSSRLAELDANIVGATYTSCIGSVEGSFEMYPFDGIDPIEQLARTQNAYVCPHGLEMRTKAMAEAVDRIGIDGIVFASNRSCKPYSITQMDQQRRMADEFGIPSVMIDVDHADVRKYNEENAFLRIEALLERIGKNGS